MELVYKILVVIGISFALVLFYAAVLFLIIEPINKVIHEKRKRMWFLYYTYSVNDHPRHGGVVQITENKVSIGNTDYYSTIKEMLENMEKGKVDNIVINTITEIT